MATQSAHHSLNFGKFRHNQVFYCGV
jgi:hypothetical protein